MSKHVKGRHSVVCENMVHQRARGLKPRSHAFNVDTITATLYHKHHGVAHSLTHHGESDFTYDRLIAI